MEMNPAALGPLALQEPIEAELPSNINVLVAQQVLARPQESSGVYSRNLWLA